MGYHEIWLWDDFQTKIIYHAALQIWSWLCLMVLGNQEFYVQNQMIIFPKFPQVFNIFNEVMLFTMTTDISPHIIALPVLTIPLTGDLFHQLSNAVN